MNLLRASSRLWPTSWLEAGVVATLLWNLSVILFCCVAVALALLGGCARTVLVPESSPIRVGPETRARIYAMTDGEWTLSDNCVTIPEGWYCVPPSYVAEEDR